MIPDFYEFFCPVKIVSGKKALANLPYEMERLGARRALVVTDKGVAGAGLVQKVEAVFAGSQAEIGAIFDETPVDSSYRAVNRIARLYRDQGCDCLVAVGGGSPIDTAKGVNIVVSEDDDDLLKFQGVDCLTKDARPLIVVPTTAGTGSEVTCIAVISDEDRGVKMPFLSSRLYPHTAILDPEMTQTMPPRITAATGMDALTHAVEAYYCLGKNPVSDAYAVTAIRLVLEHLTRCVEDGGDGRARLAMANAALLAGIAFSNSMVGVVHSLAHACGGVCHVPHGVANAVLLPWGMEYNLDRVAETLGELAPLLGAEAKGTARQRAEAAIAAVRDLGRRLHDLCGLPTTLREAGVAEDQLESVARAAINDGGVTYNPEDVTFEDALAILKKAF